MSHSLDAGSRPITPDGASSLARDPLPIAIELMEIDSTSGREGEVIGAAERLQ